MLVNMSTPAEEKRGETGTERSRVGEGERQRERKKRQLVT
jgi:hypothetical protein